MSTHTLGPWDAHDNGHIYGDNYASAVARVFENTHQRDGEAQANARLIAAAPDMFAALESLRASLPELEDHPNEPLPGTVAVDVLCEHWPRILEAIHKAKGEA